ncbi:hypothetical protein [Streptosporangium vulgare]
MTVSTNSKINNGGDGKASKQVGDPNGDRRTMVVIRSDRTDL